MNPVERLNFIIALGNTQHTVVHRGTVYKSTALTQRADIKPGLFDVLAHVETSAQPDRSQIGQRKLPCLTVF